MATASYTLPPAIAPYRGEIMDVDAHEQVPINRWREYFGPVVDGMIEAIGRSKLRAAVPYDEELPDINAETVWTVKKGDAPGSFDFDRRLKVLDFMGVRRQLMFPGSYGLFAMAFYVRADDPTVFSTIQGDRRAYARATIAAYNDWCVEQFRHTDRLRPVAILVQDDVEDLVSSARHLLQNGIRAFWISCASPLAGHSPAHPALDRFWAMLAEADATLLSHVGAEEGFLATNAWRDAPAFEGWKGGDEFALDPWTLSGVHRPIENFLSVMVLGGVFERHPRLRFGACESTAHWIGPLAQNLDIWHSNATLFQQSPGTHKLAMKPSEYIRRNVRVCPFWMEPVDAYIRQFGMSEVYCYGSDFPHPEGGRNPMGDFTRQLEPFGDEVLRGFFIDNAKWIMPD